MCPKIPQPTGPLQEIKLASFLPEHILGHHAAVRDGHYVLDLCDEVLRQQASREHCFEWLLGDPGRDGRRRQLPVDGYYEALRLVIEYRERQHEQPGPRHWNKPTISGVPRDQQRRRYDERRDLEIPARGFRLVTITPQQLDSTPRGRLRRRDRAADLAAVRAVLVAAGVYPPPLSA